MNHLIFLFTGGFDRCRIFPFLSRPCYWALEDRRGAYVKGLTDWFKLLVFGWGVEHNYGVRGLEDGFGVSVRGDVTALLGHPETGITWASRGARSRRVGEVGSDSPSEE